MIDQEQFNREGFALFQGHLVASSCLFSIGFFWLCVTFKRCRELRSDSSYCEEHVPERNQVLLGRFGLTLTGMGWFGFFYEGIIAGSNFFEKLPHQALYLCYAFVGFCSYMVSKGRVARDSHYAALSLVSFLQYLLWLGHANMKEDTVERLIHILVARICLVLSISSFYYFRNPKVVQVYLLNWALMVLYGMWLFTAGVYRWRGQNSISMHHVDAFFALETLAVAFVILVASAFFAGETNYFVNHNDEVKHGDSSRTLGSSTETYDSVPFVEDYDGNGDQQL